MGGGLFQSQKSTPQVPVPVEKVPGLQNLGQQLISRFMQILTGQLQQKPFSGYGSVYGGPGGTFPGIYANNPAAVNNLTSASSSASPSSFSDFINQQINAAINSGTVGGKAAFSGEDAGAQGNR